MWYRLHDSKLNFESGCPSHFCSNFNTCIIMYSPKSYAGSFHLCCNSHVFFKDFKIFFIFSFIRAIWSGYGLFAETKPSSIFVSIDANYSHKKFNSYSQMYMFSISSENQPSHSQKKKIPADFLFVNKSDSNELLSGLWGLGCSGSAAGDWPVFVRTRPWAGNWRKAVSPFNN